jgi:hypothetical protein
VNLAPAVAAGSKEGAVDGRRGVIVSAAGGATLVRVIPEKSGPPRRLDVRDREPTMSRQAQCLAFHSDMSQFYSSLPAEHNASSRNHVLRERADTQNRSIRCIKGLHERAVLQIHTS